MVTRLSLISIPTEISEKCFQVKKHKVKFEKYAGCRIKCHIDVVYSDMCEPMQVGSIYGNIYFVTFIHDHNR